MMAADKIHCFSESSFVEFLPLPDNEISRYIATGEPMDKAGATGYRDGRAFCQKDQRMLL
jgi:predicted house-cleaning NTP pyrophosphatase (Maf/HAM1 superfamily)